MHYYTLKPGLGAAAAETAGMEGMDQEPCVRVLTKREAADQAKKDGLSTAGRLLEQNIRFSGAEAAPDYLMGSFYIPSKSMHKAHTSFYFILERNSASSGSPPSA